MAKAKRKFARRVKSLRERVAEALHALRLHALRLRVTERIRLRRAQLARLIEPR